MRKVLWCMLFLLAGGAFAGELAKPKEMISRVVKQREVAPLLYVLPSLGTSGRANMEIRILQGKHLLIREVVKLPAGVAAGAAVDVLFTHPDEIKKLRTIEAETPGSLRFISLIEERVITDEPFAAIEAGGAKAALASAVGEIAEVEVKAPPRLRVRANDFYEDDPCWQQCNVSYQSCLEWCDPRGDSCTLCEIWYHDCYIECPSPPASCSEPKSTSTVTSRTPVAAYWAGQSACVFGWEWDYDAVTYQITIYQRTEHCDGSHTDVAISSYYQTIYCWYQTFYSCYPNTATSVFPQCY